MNKYLVSSLLSLAIVATPASAQDLDSLKTRAGRLWTERLQANKSKAAEFIEKEGRSDFPMYEEVKEATLTGLEFTQDKSRVLVTTKAKVFIPFVGNTEQTITEPWVWKSGNWFVQVGPVAANPFEINRGATAATTVHSGFTFQLVDKKIDLGAHKQGEKITGTVKFAALRSALQLVRARGMDGFRIGATRWTDDKNGELDFTIDSSLISQDFETTVVLEAQGPERVFEISTASENLTVVGRIEGKIQISQLPQTPEAEKGRFVELEFKNVGKASFSVEKIRPLDTHFVVTDAALPSLAPGQTAKVALAYGAQARLVDGELIIQLSDGVLPSNSALFRIKGPVPESAQQQRQGLTRAELDEAARRAREDVQRRAPQ